MGLSYPSFCPLQMLSKAVIACWCLSGSAQISRFYAFSKDPSSSSGRLFFVSLLCLFQLPLNAFLSAHPTFKLLCPLKSHIHGYFVLFFKSIFTRRSWPSVPLHGRIQRREVGCHYSDGCSCGWDSVLLDDMKFIPHCVAGGHYLACGTSLCVPTQGWHHAVGTGLCSPKGEAPQTVFNIKDKYILVETLREFYLVVFWVFFLYLSIWERRGFILSH